ncbi:Fe2+-dicitrate sensor, membrane component [Aequorivita sublithincola DSM 14238]|uniref:Fe2+-dicitrate sensor, membrane component n=1 Tax=Aequorivita sublithincola (strain DSM 14238 / LMG 21431 / ACAM 643 / 9-3) TaxID=746697 RepID=I3YRL6_AEQSU|nr:FecR domain-containing protein [Aequorivita sublithincola]AFL79634.1 Fe2+-dicitrate sensor, membrane component [Aequorivita sublithincola DSM 14238]
MKTLIIKYLNETISEAEKLQLIEWLQTPKNQKTFKEFVKINHRLNKLSASVDSETAYSKLMTNLSAVKITTPIRKLIPHWLKYAAVFVGVAILTYGIYLNSPQKNAFMDAPQITLQLEDGSIKIIDENNNSTIVDADGNIISEQKQNELVYGNATPEETLQYNTLNVPYGKTFKLVLSDGSQVVLNAGTKLKYPVNFIKSENRTVFLDGEAYFEVAKDPLHPFIVNTKDMDVEVLGTHFNVTSYTNDQKTYTVLVEGKVAAHSKLANNDTKIISPNEKAVFENETLQIVEVNVAKYVAWVQGELVFVDDSFKVIANKLERKFNVKIENNYPELAKIYITATFKNETIEEVLKTFQTYKNFDYYIKNGTVTINKPKK